MSVAKLIAELPDDTRVSVTVGSGSLTWGEVRRATIATQGSRVLTTSEAAELFGGSPSGWAKRAARGEVEGAWQEAKGGPWNLPYASCEANVARRQAKALKRNRRGRPWKSKGVPGGRLSVVPGGPAPVRREEGGDARPGRSGMAGGGAQNRQRGGG